MLCRLNSACVDLYSARDIDSSDVRWISARAIDIAYRRGKESAYERMFPDRRGRPTDPRLTSDRLSRPLGETRNFLTQAASLLTPSGTSSALGARGPSTQWQRNLAGPTTRSSSCHGKRFNIFRSQASRQSGRSLSVPGRSRKRKLWEHTF